MTVEQVQSLKLGISVDDKTVLSVESALEWLEHNTTIDVSDVENLSASARLFISKFVEIQKRNSTVSSESIEGLSLSFSSDKTEDLIWSKAQELLGDYLKSRIRFVAAQKRWKEWA